MWVWEIAWNGKKKILMKSTVNDIMLIKKVLISGITVPPATDFWNKFVTILCKSGSKWQVQDLGEKLLPWRRITYIYTWEIKSILQGWKTNSHKKRSCFGSAATARVRTQQTRSQSISWHKGICRDCCKCNEEEEQIYEKSLCKLYLI